VNAPLESLELRWFLSGTSFPRLQDWFCNQLPADETFAEDPREDRYLVLPGIEDASVKFSRGKLEVKARDVALPFHGAHGTSGQVERWVKWEVKDANAQPTGLDSLGKSWITVEKQRTQRKYRRDNGRFVAIPSADVPKILDTGVALEICQLKVRGEWHATVLVEAFAEHRGSQEQLLSDAASELLRGLPAALQPPAASYGYPRWLSTVIQNGESSPEASAAFLNTEYDFLKEQFISNEEMGDKRVAMFVSLTAGLGAAAVLVNDKLADGATGGFRELFLAINALWLLFGYVTFLRVVHRNKVTDTLKDQMRRVRTGIVRESDAVTRSKLPYDPYGPADKPRAGLKLIGGKGGYAELVALIIAALSGALAFQLYEIARASRDLVGVRYGVLATVYGLITAALAWRWLDKQARLRYSSTGQ